MARSPTRTDRSRGEVSARFKVRRSRFEVQSSEKTSRDEHLYLLVLVLVTIGRGQEKLGLVSVCGKRIESGSLSCTDE
jgi:hypothetical protein